jgi:hypothetical protein
VANTEHTEHFSVVLQGAFIARAFERVGPNGHVVIEESATSSDDLDFTEVRRRECSPW